jgi:uncharacterized protein (TIGR02453 family)
MKISESVFSFLSGLKENNNKEWFTTNKELYNAEKEQIGLFFKALFLKLNEHDAIEKLKQFRIYRDVRFSADKTPYKSHFAAHYVRESNKLRGGYYVHIKPGESFIAGGFWEPNKDDLLRIRKEFEMDADEIRAIVSEKNFIHHFGTLQGDALQTAPRGFDKNHRNIDLIKMKQFIAVKEFTDSQVLQADFLDKVSIAFMALRPFFDYMSEVLTTDLNGESIL